MRNHLSGGLVFLWAVTLATSADAQGPKTVWEGVYTSAQANRGQGVYDASCTECHQDDLTGGGCEGASPLVGADFLARWNNRPLADLFGAVADAMPKGAPGSLTPDEYADVISFLLKKNLIPASDAPLATDPASLGEILFTETPR